MTAGGARGDVSMDMMKVSAIALVGAVALLLFKQYKPEWGIPTRLVLGIVLSGILISGVGEIISFAEALIEGNTMTTDMWRLILKGLGIALITEIAMGICRDSGEGGLAAWVEMAGKTAILILALPLIREVMLAVKDLLGLGG